MVLGMSRTEGVKEGPLDGVPSWTKELGEGVWYCNRLQWPKMRESQSLRLISQLAVTAPMTNHTIRLGPR